MSTLDGEADFYESDTLTYRSSTEFYETELPNGYYAIVFEMSDIRGNTVTSEAAIFDYTDGDRTYNE